MIDQGNYFRGLLRRRATQVRAEVRSIRADGSYVVRREDTQGDVIAQPGDVTLSLSIGQIVWIAIPDRSGAVSGSGYFIQAPATTNSRNSSLASRVTSSVNNAGETLVRVVSGGVAVERVTLTHGGATVTILVYGTNLTSSATYGNAGITDAVSQVVTSTLITLQVHASGGTPLGLYSLTVAGQTLSNFFSVI